MRARHVEVQILGDSHGEIYHLMSATALCSAATKRSLSAPLPRIFSAHSANEICELGENLATCGL